MLIQILVTTTSLALPSGLFSSTLMPSGAATSLDNSTCYKT